MQEFKLTVRTPYKVMIQEQVTSASFLMDQGMVTIYANHAMIMGQTHKGEIIYKVGEEMQRLDINPGFVKVTGDQVELLIER